MWRRRRRHHGQVTDGRVRRGCRRLFRSGRTRCRAGGSAGRIGTAGTVVRLWSGLAAGVSQVVHSFISEKGLELNAEIASPVLAELSRRTSALAGRDMSACHGVGVSRCVLRWRLAEMVERSRKKKRETRRERVGFQNFETT